MLLSVERFKKEITYIGLFAVLMVVLVIWNATTTKDTFVTTAEVVLRGQIVRVALADTPSIRSQGLSGTPYLPADVGMLFIFEEPARYGFWMKDMQYPLDIIWIDEFGKVSHVSPRVTPSSYPESFAPPKPVKYVLEVNAGFAEKHGVRAGDSTTFNFPH